MTRIRTCAAAAALALAALVLPGSAAHAADVPACPGGSICFYGEEGFDGDTWEWSSGSGYRDMPPNLHDHVGSFVSQAAACFIDYHGDGTAERRTVNAGDYRSQYLGDFGGRIDAVSPGAC